MTTENQNVLSLSWALMHLARNHGLPLDVVKLQATISASLAQKDALKEQEIEDITILLGWQKCQMLSEFDRVYLPLLGFSTTHGWGVIVNHVEDDCLMIQTFNGNYKLVDASNFKFIIRLVPPDLSLCSKQKTFKSRVFMRMSEFRGIIGEAVVASILINVLTALTSFFSLQVYDKVIPSRSIDTLIVMFTGVVIIIVFEWIMKWARSRIMETAIVGVDGHLSREVFERLLSVRLDQMPRSVGSLASQLRGYEQVRGFYTSSALFALVDVPAAIIFVVVIAFIASPLLAAVPMVLAFISIFVGWYFRKKVLMLAKAGMRESNMKTGLLVETLEGAETIKAAHGGWRFLSKWIDLNSNAINNNLIIRHTDDGLKYFLSSVQQFSYSSLIACGSLLVIQGNMSMGSLIASSILGGRVLAAIMLLPNLMVQHAHASAAAEGLDELYKLGTDFDPHIRPLNSSTLSGNFLLENVSFKYIPNGPPALQIRNLKIKSGERVGIIGPIGSGKSTFLKVIAGLYRPTDGRVLIDGLDVAHISRESLSRKVSYLQQDHRLFQGTLRENLLIGLPDPGDDVLMNFMTKTGLLQLVSSHPLGLDLPIFEGGKGLSGGQKQLVSFTRMLLSNPSVMLLDEPTASMDGALENRCLQLFKEPEFSRSTILLVTHKTSLLFLVERLIVIVNGNLVMDGPREDVLKVLKTESGVASIV